MSLTENAKRVYLGTDMGNVARQSEDFDHFNSQWCAKMIMLFISKNPEDKKIYEAMKSIQAFEFYYDANRY